MNSQSTISTHRHSAWQDLLQIVGALAVIGFHVGLPHCQIGWAAVELFFVMAGMRMASHMDRGEPFSTYVWARYRRILPEMGFMWLAVAVFVLLGSGTTGMRWFLASSPFEVHNLSPLLFDYQLPRDSVFGPLWFTAVLLQLQLGVFALRSPLRKLSPEAILGCALSIGIGSRFVFGCLDARDFQMITARQANLLYTMPFCHLEALVIGFLLGRGELKWLGNRLPQIALIVVLVGMGTHLGADHHLDLHQFGYEFPLRLWYAHLWGYPALAFLAAALCADGNPLWRLLIRMKPAPGLRPLMQKAAGLTFGAYCFHGLIIASGLNGSDWLGNSPFQRVLLFLITAAESFLLAAIFNHLPAILGSRTSWRHRPETATSFRHS